MASLPAYTRSLSPLPPPSKLQALFPIRAFSQQCRRWVSETLGGVTKGDRKHTRVFKPPCLRTPFVTPTPTQQLAAAGALPLRAFSQQHTRVGAAAKSPYLVCSFYLKGVCPACSCSCVMCLVMPADCSLVLLGFIRDKLALHCQARQHLPVPCCGVCVLTPRQAGGSNGCSAACCTSSLLCSGHHTSMCGRLCDMHMPKRTPVTVKVPFFSGRRGAPQ